MLEHPPPVPTAILMARGNAIRKHFQLIIDTSLSAGLHFNVILGETAAVLFWCVSGFPLDCTAHSPPFLQALLAVAYSDRLTAHAKGGWPSECRIPASFILVSFPEIRRKNSMPIAIDADIGRSSPITPPGARSAVKFPAFTDRRISAKCYWIKHTTDKRESEVLPWHIFCLH